MLKTNQDLEAAIISKIKNYEKSSDVVERTVVEQTIVNCFYSRYREKKEGTNNQAVSVYSSMS